MTMDIPRGANHWSGHPGGGAAVRAAVDLLVHAEFDRMVFAWWLRWPEITWLATRPGEVGDTVRQAVALVRKPAERHVAQRRLANQIYDDSGLLVALLEQLAIRSPERARSLLRRALMEIARGEGVWQSDAYRAIAQKFLDAWPASGDCPECGERLVYAEDDENARECVACDYRS